MPDPRRSIEIELQWLVSVYSPNILSEIQTLLKTALEACGTEYFDGNHNFKNASIDSMKSLFPPTTLTLRGSDKDVFCVVSATGDRITKASFYLTIPDWNRGNQLIVETSSSEFIILEQIFNASNIVALALEQLDNANVPASGTDDCFARSTFVSKLNDVKRLLSRGIQQLVNVDPQNIFPYTIFDSRIYNTLPDDLVIEFFIQSGKLCANVYVIISASHQSPSHVRQKSTVSQPSAVGSGPNQFSSSYYFYNGSPVELMYQTRLEAALPSAVTALTSIENALGLLDDLYQKIDCIQKLLESY